MVNVSVSGMRQVSAGGDGSDAAADAADVAWQVPKQLFLRRFQQQFGGTGTSMQVPVRGVGAGFIVSATRSVALLVQRGGEKIFVAIRLT